MIGQEKNTTATKKLLWLNFFTPIYAYFYCSELFNSNLSLYPTPSPWRQCSRNDSVDFHSQPILFFSFFSECPLTTNGERQFACPRLNPDSDPVCISTQKLCNFEADCPGADDEDEKLCLFHRPVSITPLPVTTQKMVKSKFLLDRIIP